MGTAQVILDVVVLAGDCDEPATKPNDVMLIRYLCAFNKQQMSPEGEWQNRKTQQWIRKNKIKQKG